MYVLANSCTSYPFLEFSNVAATIRPGLSGDIQPARPRMINLPPHKNPNPATTGYTTKSAHLLCNTGSPSKEIGAKSSEVFVPSLKVLGSYHFVNLEADDSDPVISHRRSQDLNNSSGSENPSANHSWGGDGSHWGGLRDLLEKIEGFVDAAMRLDIPQGLDLHSRRSGNFKLARLKSFYLKRIFEINLPNYPDFQFSEHVHLFMKHFEALEITRKYAELIKPRYPPRPSKDINDITSELFSLLARRICAEGHSDAFTKRCRDRQTNIQRNIKNYCDYVDALVERNSPLLVLRIDLEYTRSAVRALTIDQVRNDMKRFLNNQRHKKLFSGQRGFIWKLQNRDLRGLHFHVILFLSDAETTQPQILTQQIGEYWMQVTGDRGCYQDCSKSVYPYQRLGIGKLNLDDAEKLADLHSVVTYLCERDQVLTVKEVSSIHHGRLK